MAAYKVVSEALPPLRAFKGIAAPKSFSFAQPRIIDSVVAPPEPGRYADWILDTLPKQWKPLAAHQIEIAKLLDAVTLGQVDRFAIHMPPRHAKTETVTKRYPIQQIQLHPADWYLVTGYNERFARRLGRAIRNLAVGRVAMNPDKQASDEWATLQGGGLMTRGVGSPPTGIGFGGILIDDPIRRREDAESEVYREKVFDWYTDDLYTRLQPKGWIGLIMTLWHHDDIGARAKASEPNRWVELNLKAIAEEDDVLNRMIGEALWPQVWTREDLLRIKGVMGQNEGLRSWEALYQQNPTPKEGAFFKVSMFQIVDAVPVGLKTVRWWDTAATAGGGDWTVGVKMAGPDFVGNYYVIDVVRGQWDTAERNRIIKLTAELDGKHVLQGGPQDPGAAGKDSALAFVKNLGGFNVKTEVVTGKKDFRADPYSAQVNAGNVRIFRGAWNLAYIEEHRLFTGKNDKHDDQVDAGADAFNELALGVVVGAYF